MSNNRDRGDRSSTRPTCPWCGQAVRSVVVSGPTEAVASPCDCRVPIGSVTDLEDD